MNQINWQHDNALKAALDIVLSGGVIIYPTDTLYGFGADATNKDAINKVNRLKKRTGPMSVLATDKKIATRWINLQSTSW